jgi:hypothetical protein
LRVTLRLMSTITFRSDPEVDKALGFLTGDRGDRSRAIRDAILDAWHARQEAALRAEALSLAGDAMDVAEARAVLSDMESIRAW